MAIVGIAVAAAATGCYAEKGFWCSVFYDEPSDPCPDEFVVDWQVSGFDAGAVDAPGRTNLDYTSCWVYVQPMVMIFECEPAGLPILGGPFPYWEPYGDLCDL